MISLQDGRKELFQWDTNRYIVLDKKIGDVAEIHFANGVFNRSIDVKEEEGKALIPDVLLQYARPLRVWVFVGEPSDGYTKVEHVFKVNERNKPSDYVFTPTEQLSLQELIEKFEDFKDSIGNEVEEYLKENPVDVVEKDPTVPQWAKLPNKPTYTAAEVGARSDRWLPTLEEIGAQPKGDYALKSEIPAISDAPVKSVNGKTGEVKLTAKDVGALEENVDLVTPEEVEDAIDKYMQEHPTIVEETDPTVPIWAKQSEKPKYTPEEIGAQPKGDYALKSEIPAVPVQSVNGKTGAVQLSAADVGALHKDTPIPAPYTLPVASAETLGGVKVGEGLEMSGEVLGVRKRKLELIEEITLSDSVTEVKRTKEPDGTNYKFDELQIVIIADKSDSAKSILAYAGKTPEGNGIYIYQQYANTTNYTTSVFDWVKENGFWKAKKWSVASSAFPLGGSVSKAEEITGPTMCKQYSETDIPEIWAFLLVGNGAPISAGVRIQIWGVRTDA